MPPNLPQHHLAPRPFGKDRGREAGRTLCVQPASPSRVYWAVGTITPRSCPEEGQASHISFSAARAALAEGLVSIDRRRYLSALSTAAFRVGQEPTPNPRSALAVFGGVLKVTCKGKNKNGFVPHLLHNNA